MFDWPNEYLLSIKGTFDGTTTGTASMTSLSFETNRKTYGPFKVPKGRIGSTFEFPLEGRVVVGFYGRELLCGDGRRATTGGFGIYTKHTDDISEIMKPKPLQVSHLPVGKLLFNFSFQNSF